MFEGYHPPKTTRNDTQPAVRLSNHGIIHRGAATRDAPRGKLSVYRI